MIRNANINDSEKIYKLLKQIALVHHNLYPELFENRPKYSLEDVNSLLNDKKKIVRVLEDESDILGHLIGWYEDDYFYIDDLCVDETKRGKRLGQQLLLDIEKFVSVEKIRLNVWLRNEQAYGFYEKNAYEPLKVVMEKRVK